MLDNNVSDIKVNSNGISYYITTGSDPVRPFGIFAVLDDDKTDCSSVENLYFTIEEAVKCCEWLAENNVFPITLCEIISDFYHI